MKRKKTENFSETWFFKWILNNQAVVAFFILLLIGLTVLIFTKISPIFSPVIQFMTIIMLPLVISMLLYYLIKPLVLLSRKNGIESNHVYLGHIRYPWLALGLGDFNSYSKLTKSNFDLDYEMHHHILHVPIVKRNVGLICLFFLTSMVI